MYLMPSSSPMSWMRTFLLQPVLGLGRRAFLRIGADHLQRDRDAELGIPRLVDGAHAADAEQLDDVIPRTKRLPDLQRTGCLRALDPGGANGHCHFDGGTRRRDGAKAGHCPEGRPGRQPGRIERDNTHRDRVLHERGPAGRTSADGDGRRLSAVGTNHGQIAGVSPIMAASRVTAKQDLMRPATAGASYLRPGSVPSPA